MGVILVWPHAGLAGYIADDPLRGSGNTFWHPEQCLQQTSFISPSGGTGIDPVIPTVAVLLPSQYCQTRPLTFTIMSHQQEALAVAQETETVAQYLCKKFHNLQVWGYDRLTPTNGVDLRIPHGG